MPIYEYLCRACGNSFEKVVRSVESQQPECPKCGSGDIERQLSSFAAPAGSASGGCGHSGHSGGGG